jgi:hypothetical protein
MDQRQGDVVAKDVADLHGPNALTKQSALNEKGEVINGRGDQPNRHDILTGSQPDGTAFAAGDDKTCKNWTSSTQGSAVVGHSDRIGLRDDDASKSWNSSHGSRGRRADARRRTCEAPAATACCIVSHRTDWSFRAFSVLGAEHFRAECVCEVSCGTNSITGRPFRGAVNMFGWRWKMPAPITSMSPARQRRGKMMKMMEAAKGTPPFAPPFLKAGKLVIGQTANILLYLGPRHGLAPKAEAPRCGCISFN